MAAPPSKQARLVIIGEHAAPADAVRTPPKDAGPWRRGPQFAPAAWRSVWSCLFLVAAVAAAEDLVVLRDGSSRTGVLQSCSGDRCTLAGSPILTREIAWIGLGQQKQATPAIAPATVDQAVLRDGTTREGSLVGVSLGLVILDGMELARSEVAWIRFADLTAGSADFPPAGDPPPSTPDAIAMRDGSARIGELVACVGGSCLLEGQPRIERASIAAIGFGGGEQKISSSGTGDEDRVLLRDGATHDGAVLAIDPEQVITSARRFARASVAAVLFADDQAPAGPWGAPQDPEPQREPPAQTPPPGGGDSPPPMPSPPAPGAPNDPSIGRPLRLGV